MLPSAALRPYLTDGQVDRQTDRQAYSYYNIDGQTLLKEKKGADMNTDLLSLYYNIDILILQIWRNMD